MGLNLYFSPSLPSPLFPPLTSVQLSRGFVSYFTNHKEKALQKATWFETNQGK